MKMKKKNIRTWIKALRSGKYKQTQSRLRRGDSFCCLGVACALYGKQFNKRFRKELFMHRSTTLPIPVLDWLGITSSQEAELYKKNDGIGGYGSHSFSEIADILKSWIK